MGDRGPPGASASRPVPARPAPSQPVPARPQPLRPRTRGAAAGGPGIVPAGRAPPRSRGKGLGEPPARPRGGGTWSREPRPACPSAAPRGSARSGGRGLKRVWTWQSSCARPAGLRVRHPRLSCPARLPGSGLPQPFTGGGRAGAAAGPFRARDSRPGAGHSPRTLRCVFPKQFSQQFSDCGSCKGD